MCGIVGIVGTTPVNQSIYDALTVLQHRGQDAAGICTIDSNRFRLRKANGLVKDVFEAKHMQRLQGSVGIGHVRYPTAGSSSASEAQPFYVNSPFGITLAHNGNLTNANVVREKLFEKDRRHINTTSDSEVLLNVLAHEIDTVRGNVTSEDVFRAVANVHRTIRGAYAVTAMIIGHGMIAFRDPHGIRPLCLGKRVASESVALDAVGFDFVRDVAPGEAIYATFEGELFTKQCADSPSLTPCIFEFVYFARPDSFIDKISVYSARVEMGKRLGERIKNEFSDLDIDVVIPIPETSNDIALQISSVLIAQVLLHVFSSLFILLVQIHSSIKSLFTAHALKWVNVLVSVLRMSFLTWILMLLFQFQKRQMISRCKSLKRLINHTVKVS